MVGNVSVENVASVTTNKKFSCLQTLEGPSGKDFTDFDKIIFTITTKNDNAVNVNADRCDGADSLSDKSGDEIFR